jgi:hypothetical protein
MYSPHSVQGHHHVGVLVFVELHRRIHKGAFGKVPQPIRDDAFGMSCYCLDAPDIMPAGSVFFDRYGPEPDDWLPMVTTVTRGEALDH